MLVSLTPLHRAGYHLPDPVSRPIDRLVQISPPLLQHDQFMRESNSQPAALVIRPLPGPIDVADTDTDGSNSLRKAIQGKSEPPLGMQPDSIRKREFLGTYLNQHAFLPLSFSGFGDLCRRAAFQAHRQLQDVQDGSLTAHPVARIFRHAQYHLGMQSHQSPAAFQTAPTDHEAAALLPSRFPTLLV
jgi:hypothetical protein